MGEYMRRNLVGTIAMLATFILSGCALPVTQGSMSQNSLDTPNGMRVSAEAQTIAIFMIFNNLGDKDIQKAVEELQSKCQNGKVHNVIATRTYTFYFLYLVTGDKYVISGNCSDGGAFVQNPYPQPSPQPYPQQVPQQYPQPSPQQYQYPPQPYQ
jgi:hypothetical protein